MGKEGELWDDRALLNAFDDAISNYKKMHAKKTQLDSAVREEDEKSNAASVNVGTELVETKNKASVKEHDGEDLINDKPIIDASNVPDLQAKFDVLTLQAAEDYNQLLSLYYEVEEKRQKILQQLQQFGGYNYQSTADASGAGAQWGSCSTSLCTSDPAGQQCLSNAFCSCCPFVCHYSSVPCTSVPACSLCGTCSDKKCTESSNLTQPGNSLPSIGGVNVVKTAMESAEKALSSIKINSSVDSAAEEEGKSKDSEGKMAQVANSGTDLTTVLNAWYSAGFYTGKYLAEKSIAKN